MPTAAAFMTRPDWTPTHLDALRAQIFATWMSWGASQRRALTREYFEATATGLARPESIPVTPDAYFAPGKRPFPRETPEARNARVSATWEKWKCAPPRPATDEPPKPRRCRHGLWSCVLCGLHSGFPMTGWYAR